MKKIYRSRKDKMLGGVCGGLSAYFCVDVTLIRIIWVVVALAGGIGFLAYVIAWVLIPLSPATEIEEDSINEVTADSGCESAWEAPDREERMKIFGYVLLGIGIYFLVVQFLPWVSLARLWPAVLIVIGLLVVYKGLGGRR
ncbi:MAG: PspC domain-containing protein [Bacillota bacterium]